MRLLARRRAPALPALLCRFDLDKTYLKSEFDTLRQLWRTARERGEDKVAVPGVPDVLKALRAAGERHGRTVAIFFVSASPPQIGKAIRDKLALDGVPYDGIVFKNQLDHLKRGHLRQLREHVGFKLDALLRGRRAMTGDVRELLFGDDWESDPFTYSVYADVLDGTLADDRLAAVLDRVGVDPALRPEIHALAADVAGRGGVDRIFINLERRTPPAVFRLYGARVVPTFNYFQTALALAAEGWMEGDDVLKVARSLAERNAFTPRRLENSLADLVRRGLVVPAVRRLSEPLRDAGLLPIAAHGRMAWLDRALDRLGRGGAAPSVSSRRATSLDYDAILDRLRPAGAAT